MRHQDLILPGFKDLSITYITGVDPALVCFAGVEEAEEDSWWAASIQEDPLLLEILDSLELLDFVASEVDRVDLRAMTVVELHELMATRGVQPFCCGR